MSGSDHRVAIIGGGFAGLKAAQMLGSRPVDVTLIDKRNFHLFQPLLYQVATGSLSPGDITAPLRSVLHKHKNIRVLLGEVDDIDVDSHNLHLTDGGLVPYDSLIVAAGSRSTYFGHDEWREWAPGLKSVEEATRVRQKIFFAFEEAERLGGSPEQSAWLTFAIVGGGATGVELAGALSEIARDTLRSDFRSIDPGTTRIILIEGGARILATFAADLAQKARSTLERRGVEVLTDRKVVSVDASGIAFDLEDETRETITCKTVLWSAGITASALGNILASRAGMVPEKGGKIKVKPDLTVPNHPEIFVVGDLASLDDESGKPFPGVAQVAMQGGTYAAKTILDRLQGKPDRQPFHYFNKGDMAVIGRGSAIADIFGFHAWGLPAWLIWLFIHLMYLEQFDSRVRTFIQWGFEYLTYNRGARLITGSNTCGLGKKANQ